MGKEKGTPRQADSDDIQIVWSDPELEEAYKKEKAVFNAKIDKMSKMKFLDFREAVVGLLKSLGDSNEADYAALTQVAGIQKKYIDTHFDVIAKKFKNMDEDLEECMKIIDERLRNLEHFIFMVWFKVMSREGPVSYKDKKRVSEYLGIDWDKTVEDLMAHVATGGEV